MGNTLDSRERFWNDWNDPDARYWKVFSERCVVRLSRILGERDHTGLIGKAKDHVR